MEDELEIKALRIGFNKGIEAMEIHPDDDNYDSVRFDEAIEELSISKKYVYRKKTKGRVITFEIGEIDMPKSNYRKEYPDSWCDRRICEGFWGDEKAAIKVVKLLNS